MGYIYENIGQLVLMLILLMFSAFFSGSETAFFNLSRRQIEGFRKSSHKLQRLVYRILKNPSNLLSSLLFGNMCVNILFYALSSVIIINIEQRSGVTEATIAAITSFALVLLFGEIAPKSFAYANSLSVSTFAALPAYVILKVLTPIVGVFRLLIVEPALRIILGAKRRTKAVSSNEFMTLIDQIKKRGLISADENKLLAEIIEFGFLKVRDCLRPRVDMIACSVTDSNAAVRAVMQANNLTKIPVYVDNRDNIVGLLYHRQLLLHVDTSCDKLVQKAFFVPELKTIESLLEFFRRSHTDMAVVVDEYGGIAGSVSLEDIAEELLGPIESPGQEEPIQQIGPFKYRLAGDLAIHDWARVFDIDPAEARISTIAGLVSAVLGKIPQAGDIAYLKNLKFEVEQVRKHRIKSLILTLETPEADHD